MGKSLYIQRMVELLQVNIVSTGKACVTVPLHGPKVTPDVVMGYLEGHMRESACTIFHLDIAPNVLMWTVGMCINIIMAIYVFLDCVRGGYNPI